MRKQLKMLGLIALAAMAELVWLALPESRSKSPAADYTRFTSHCSAVEQVWTEFTWRCEMAIRRNGSSESSPSELEAAITSGPNERTILGSACYVGEKRAVDTRGTSTESTTSSKKFHELSQLKNHLA